MRAESKRSFPVRQAPIQHSYQRCLTFVRRGPPHPEEGAPCSRPHFIPAGGRRGRVPLRRRAAHIHRTVQSSRPQPGGLRRRGARVYEPGVHHPAPCADRKFRESMSSRPREGTVEVAGVYRPPSARADRVDIPALRHATHHEYRRGADLNLPTACAHPAFGPRSLPDPRFRLIEAANCESKRAIFRSARGLVGIAVGVAG